jgi:flagellar biosynthesis/type III secretory pathway protein FliH
MGGFIIIDDPDKGIRKEMHERMNNRRGISNYKQVHHPEYEEGYREGYEHGYRDHEMDMGSHPDTSQDDFRMTKYGR